MKRYRRIFIFGFFMTLMTAEKLIAIDDDFLLDVIPAIVGASSWSRPELEPVRKLTGEWVFDSFFSNPNVYFRFDQTTARAIGGPTFGVQHIRGESSMKSDFSSDWCDGKLLAIYYPLYRDYVILCDWGFPSIDLGTVYSFSQVGDSFEYGSLFYKPSNNKVLNELPYDFGIATKLTSQEKAKPEFVTTDSITAENYQESLLKIFEKLELINEKSSNNKILRLQKLIDQSLSK